MTPPTNSGLQVTTITNVVMSGNKTLNVALIPASVVTLSGHVRDGLGVGIPGIQVGEGPTSGGGGQQVATDANGAYTFQVAPGAYNLSVNGSNSNAAIAASRSLNFFSDAPVTVAGNTTVDFALPFKRVSVRVQDPSGAGVANVKLTTTNPSQDGLSAGTVTGTGTSNYGAATGATNATGDVTLWLYPTLSNSYNFIATPPTGSAFAITNLNNVTFSGDTSLVIALQFVHAQPVTTATSIRRPSTASTPPAPLP